MSGRLQYLASKPVLMLLASLLVNCTPSAQEEQEAFHLPVSINEVMASLINHSADPIWIAAWRNPQSERDWRELEHLARQLQLGGSLLTIPGTGPVDEEWTSRQGWQQYSMDLSVAAGRAVNAARSRDVELIARAGDEIVDICEGCHIDFKPDLPTMNIYGELSPTQDDF
jgi:hypothetical protein